VNDGERIGVYGGTFDPPHRAHLEIARAALQHAGLDKVLFVVAAVPPHKRGEVSTSSEDRLAMVEAALRNEPKMAASRMELEREGPSYTIDTLRALHRECPQARLFLILGGDSVRDLPKWYQPEAILQEAEVLVARRPGVDEPVPPLLEGRCQFMPLAEMPISSTTIRERLARGEDVGALLPAGVEQVIQERGLYACCQDASL
jgi:nicotinate-nucleotide adenylyltransferase